MGSGKASVEVTSGKGQQRPNRGKKKNQGAEPERPRWNEEAAEGSEAWILPFTEEV